MLKGKKILLGVTGSIAAYKAALLVRLLVKEGAEVKVIMTPAAADFISPLTLGTLSKNEVISGLSSGSTWANHVMLGRWADVMLIAPLSCNTMAKMASGLCDNLLMAVYLSATCPVMIAPAMDEDMWQHPSTRLNLNKLISWGNIVVPVQKGELASGLYGEGRMAEPDMILKCLSAQLITSNELQGKKALVTAGPTVESIDPVRFISNHSTGKMGIAIAKELQKRGATVSLVLGPVSEEIPVGLNVVQVSSAAQMYEACMQLFPGMDIAVMSAAVADYTPATVASTKIKKSTDQFSIELTRTKDILKSIGEQKKNGQLIVGFALETNNEQENAQAKLRTKNADMIVLNSLNDAGAGFGGNSNKITIFDKEGGRFDFDTKPKTAVAEDIVNLIVKKLYA